jgi:hypothetical protein
MKGFRESNVKAVWLAYCRSDVCTEFGNLMRTWDIWVDELYFLSSHFDGRNSGHLLVEMGRTGAFGSIKLRTIHRLIEKSFQFEELIKGISELQDLQNLSFTNLAGDASIILAGISTVRNRPTAGKFETALTNMPTGLVHLNVSDNEFSGIALRSFFQLFANEEPRNIPIILQASIYSLNHWIY